MREGLIIIIIFYSSAPSPPLLLRILPLLNLLLHLCPVIYFLLHLLSLLYLLYVEGPRHAAGVVVDHVEGLGLVVPEALVAQEGAGSTGKEGGRRVERGGGEERVGR